MTRLRSFLLRASTSALCATADESRYSGQVAATVGKPRLRSFLLRASTFALPPPRFALRRTSWASAARSRYGGQVAASARQARVRFAPAFASLRRGRTAGLTAAFVVIGGGSSVLACPVCFGAEETSMIDGAKLGVLVMLAVLFAVQGSFVGFFFYLRRRAKVVADIELDSEWSELQRSPRTS